MAVVVMVDSLNRLVVKEEFSMPSVVVAAESDAVMMAMVKLQPLNSHASYLSASANLGVLSRVDFPQSLEMAAVAYSQHH
jgi:hypothetical protein